MPARRILPPADRLAELLAEGKTHEQIAQFVTEQTGKAVTTKAVQVAVQRAGLAASRPRYDEWIPWTVPARFSKQYAATMLRAYGRYIHAGNDPSVMGAELYHRLCNWLAMLEDEGRVVDFDPENGFVYVTRQPGESIIRRPKEPRTRDAAVNE